MSRIYLLLLFKQKKSNKIIERKLSLTEETRGIFPVLRIGPRPWNHELKKLKANLQMQSFLHYKTQILEPPLIIILVIMNNEKNDESGGSLQMAGIQN